MVLRTISSAAVMAVMTVAMIDAADAQSRGRSEGSVTACSRYGHGCRTAPLRRAAYDYEYRLPNGTWMPCKQSCKDAFREDVIDYWETLNERAGSARGR